MENFIRSKVDIPSGGKILEGILFIPRNVCGFVILIPDKRTGTLEKEVVACLHAKGFATLALPTRFGKSINQCAGYLPEVGCEELIDATLWSQRFSKIWEVPLFYIAEGSATAVALKAAAALPDADAVVCVDAVAGLSAAEARQVKAATLLITADLEQEFGLFDIYNHLSGQKKLVNAAMADNNGQQSSRSLLIDKWLSMRCTARI